MIRNLFIFCLCLMPGGLLFAQKDYLPTKEDLEHFYTTKTYVVLEASPMSAYNFEVKEFMEKIWKLTDYEFIKQEDFPEASKNPNASFLYTSLVRFEKDKTGSRYVFLHLSLGGENETMDDLRDLVSVPLGYAGVDPDNYNYKIGILLKFIQKHIEIITDQPDIVSHNIFKYYNKNIESAHTKVVYFIKDEMADELQSPSRIAKVYPYKFKLVDRELIRNAILEENDDVVFLHKVGPEGKKSDARCYKIIIGAGDADFYYFDYHKVNGKKPDGFLSSDLKNLSK